MRILLMCLMMCLPALGMSRTVEGVMIPESIQVEQQTLNLNGAGVRSKYFVDVYVAALYLPAPSQDASAIAAADAPQSIHLHIISSLITRERLIESIEEGIQRSAGKDFPRYKPMLDELWNALTFEVKKGDVFEFTYVPGQGTRYYRNGELLQTRPEFDFKQVLFGIWLSNNPVQASLKKELLGD